MTEGETAMGLTSVYIESANPRCPLCSQPANVYLRRDRPVFEGKCERCGRIRVTQSVVDLLSQKGMLHSASAFFRLLPANSSEVPILAFDNYESLMRGLPSYSLVEKADVLLERIAAKTSGISSSFRSDLDYPLVFAQSGAEAQFLVQQLAKRGLVETERSGIDAKLTLAGWERLDQLQQEGNRSNRVFVAMSFSKEMNAIYDGSIEPAIRKAGYEPLRVDRIQHVNRIDDEIIGSIRKCRFAVADFTGQRSGVYFEAGMMLGLGRNVIWMCQKREVSESDPAKLHLHFDVRQFNFIDYEDAEEAALRLYNRILAVEGEGPSIQTKSAVI